MSSSNVSWQRGSGGGGAVRDRPGTANVRTIKREATYDGDYAGNPFCAKVIEQHSVNNFEARSSS